MDLLQGCVIFVHRQFYFLSNVLQVLRPGSRYKVSVMGVRTGNESGTISTEFATGEV